MNKDRSAGIILFSLRHQLLDAGVVVGSVLLCGLLSLTRLPGMELLGIGPNWLLIWLVVWSLKHHTLSATIAGLALGWIEDGLTSTYPSHALSLALVGFLTARLGQPPSRQKNFIVLVLLTFLMALLAEGAIALQHALQGLRPPAEIWQDYQQIALSRALLSSLWSPALAYPLNCWWEKIKKI